MASSLVVSAERKHVRARTLQRYQVGVQREARATWSVALYRVEIISLVGELRFSRSSNLSKHVFVEAQAVLSVVYFST